MTADDEVLFEQRGSAAWITMNKPKRRNALSRVMLTNLFASFEKAEQDPNIRNIVITGSGPAFCSGADLSDQPSDIMKDASVTFGQLYQKMLSVPKPIVAAVNGSAFAGGLGLIGASDIVIASEEAQFSFSEVQIGVIPAIISVLFVPKLGTHQCRRLFLSGNRFDGKRAVEIGMAHEAVPLSDLNKAVEQELTQLSKGGPIAIAECKKLIQFMDRPVDTLFEETETLSARIFASPEAQEGMAAFREKREPEWRC